MARRSSVTARRPCDERRRPLGIPAEHRVSSTAHAGVDRPGPVHRRRPVHRPLPRRVRAARGRHRLRGRGRRRAQRSGRVGQPGLGAATRTSRRSSTPRWPARASASSSRWIASASGLTRGTRSPSRRRGSLGAVKRTSVAHLNCSVAQTLDVVGEWWTLLIVRNLMFGQRRFEAIQADLGIARNILSDRLSTLVAARRRRPGEVPGPSRAVRVPPHRQGSRPVPGDRRADGVGRQVGRARWARRCDLRARVRPRRHADGGVRPLRRAVATCADVRAAGGPGWVARRPAPSAG